ncbi:hypothetical protein BDN70DRAFT_898829 [Pholiota conissans]|uniref:Uncharacterized protein n=1 Tax=Pholiota conissans TaxID=109636 RepID=A0A9P6CWI2_9AGAR|nr:hypothetical protein BDN70DRAFT_898829 [Pholiota conissans]
MLELIRDLLSNVKSNSRILNFIGSRLSTRKTEQPSMTGTTPALPACGPRRRKANAFWIVTTLGLSGIFYEKWKFKPDEVTDEVAQWHITSTALQMIWRMCGAGCSLIMTLSFMLLASGLLRIDCIGRLLITATLIFSSAGLIFSVGLSGILSLPGTGKSKCQDKWYNTTTFEEDESFLLWSLFALPLSSLSWSHFYVEEYLLRKKCADLKTGFLGLIAFWKIDGDKVAVRNEGTTMMLIPVENNVEVGLGTNLSWITDLGVSEIGVDESDAEAVEVVILF